MGFSKRYIRREDILNQIENHKHLPTLFSSDALLLDSWSSYFLENYDLDTSYLDLRKSVMRSSFGVVRFEDLPLGNGGARGTQDLQKLLKVSNILENLITKDSWVDILLAIEYFRIEIPESISGKYKELKEFFIEKIFNEFKVQSRNDKINEIIK